MKFNTIIKKSIAVSSLALVATACKPGLNNNEDAYLFAIASQQIRGLAEGNCAISLNLGTLYSGAILQQAVSEATIFTEAEFNQASGTTATALGYTNYAAVPYNVKYDAFIKGGGTYDAEARTADINSAKARVDYGSVNGAVSATSKGVQAANGNITVAAVCATTAARGAVATTVENFYNLFSDAEKTAATNFATAASQTIPTNIIAGINGGGVGCEALINGAQGAAATIEPAYQAGQAFRNGTGILACARIPASSCNLGAITTPTRSAAIAGAEATYGNIASNADCRKTDSDFMNRVRSNLFVGTPRGTRVLGTPASPTDAIGSISEGSTFPNNRIFPEAAYPISPALSNISTNFNVAFPLSAGATAQASSTIPYYKASNINIALVASCEAIGFNGLGPINTAPANQAAVQARRPLSDVKEILYAFSPLNSAATTYAAVRGATQNTVNQEGLDAIACNNSFRSRLSIPLAVGGGSLAKLNGAVSADGGASANLSTCLYGGTAAGRTTSGQLLGTTALSGIDSCPAAAASAAAKFGDAGLNTLANFPNNAAAQ